MKVYGYRTDENTNDVVLKEIYDIKEATYSGKDMGERQVVAKIESEIVEDFQIGDFIEVQMPNLYVGKGDTIQERFYIYTQPTIKKTARSGSVGNAFEHTVTFFPRQYELGTTMMRDMQQQQSVQELNGQNMIYTGYDSFTFYGGASALLKKIQAVLDARFGTGVWSYDLADTVNEDDGKNPSLEKYQFEFSGNTVWDALTKLTDEDGINTDFIVIDRTIYVGYQRPHIMTAASDGEQVTDEVFNFEYGKTSHLPKDHDSGNLFSITKTIGTKSPITRLYAYGSTRNLNRFYCSDRIRSGRYVNRLMLPSFSNDGKTDFIESPEGIRKFGVREGSKQFDDIYPSLRYMTYGDLRQIKYVIKIMGSGIEYDKEQQTEGLVDGSWAYPVARVQCYRVVKRPDNKALNMLIEDFPPEDLAIFIHATGKTIKCTLCGGDTSTEEKKEAIRARQAELDGKWENGHYRIPAKDAWKGSDYIDGSCFCVHDNGYFDADGTQGIHTTRDEWFKNIDQMPIKTTLQKQAKEAVELRQINYTDDAWVTDVFVFEKYEFLENEIPHFRRDGYSAYCYAHTTDLYSTNSGDNLPVNEVIDVSPITVLDTDANEQSGRQETFFVYLRDVGFKINEQSPFGTNQFVVGQEFHLNFYDGNLGGLNFTVKAPNGSNEGETICPAYLPNGTLNKYFFKDDTYRAQAALEKGAYWRLECIRNKDNEYAWLPNTIINANAGDHVVFLDIFMPDIYIRAAENRLLKEAQKYLNANDNGDIQYSVEFDKVRLAQVPAYSKQLREGAVMRIVDDDLQIYTDNEENEVLKSANGLLSHQPMAIAEETVGYKAQLQTIPDKQYYYGAKDENEVIKEFNLPYEAAYGSALGRSQHVSAKTANGKSYEINKMSSFHVDVDKSSISILLLLEFGPSGGMVVQDQTETKNIVTIYIRNAATDEIVSKLLEHEFPYTYKGGYADPKGILYSTDLKFRVEKAGDYYFDFQVEDAYYRRDVSYTYRDTVGMHYGYTGTISFTPTRYAGTTAILSYVAGLGDLMEITEDTPIEYLLEIPISEIGGVAQLYDTNPIYSLVYDYGGWNKPQDCVTIYPISSKFIDIREDYYRVQVLLRYGDTIRRAAHHININYYIKIPYIDKNVKSGAGLLVSCKSGNLYTFNAGKYYEITMDILNGLLFADTDASHQAFFLATDVDCQKTFTPNYTIETLSQKSKYQRIVVKFSLPTNFNALSDYYIGVRYESDGLTEYADMILYSIIERNTNQYGEIIKYTDLTIDELTIRLTDNTNEYSLGALNSTSSSGNMQRREIRATVKERQKASAWASLMSTVRDNTNAIERTEKTKEDLERQARKKFRELEALKANIFDPDGSINQVFLQTMLLQVGANSMNYILDKTRIAYQETSNIDFAKDDDGVWHLQFDVADILQHRAYTGNGNNGNWKVAVLNNAVELDNDKVYYVAIKAVRNSDEAQWIVDTKQHKVDEEEGYWYFNYGIISAVDTNHDRYFTETRGNVYIYGDNIIAGKIATIDGSSYFDLTEGSFNLGNKLKYKNGVLTIEGADDWRIPFENLQEQYDNFSSDINSLEYLKEAMVNGKTTSTGGLLLTELIQLYNKKNITAGISGLDDGVGCWFGGSYEDAVKYMQHYISNTLEQLNKIIPVIITSSGIGSKIGCFTVLSDKSVRIDNPTDKSYIIIDSESGICIYDSNGEKRIDISSRKININQTIEAKIDDGTYSFVVDDENKHLYHTYVPVNLLNKCRRSRINGSSILIKAKTGGNRYSLVGSIYLINRATEYKHVVSYFNYSDGHLDAGENTIYIDNEYTSLSDVIPSGQYFLSAEITHFRNELYGNLPYNDYPELLSINISNLVFESLAKKEIVEIGSNGITIKKSDGSYAQCIFDNEDDDLAIRLAGLPVSIGIGDSEVDRHRLWRDGEYNVKIYKP